MKLLKKASVLMAALALTAGLAAAQTETSQSGASDPGQTQQGSGPVYKEKGGVKTDYGQDRRQKAGTDQGYNTGATGQQVGKDQPAPVSGQGQSPPADTARYDRATRGTGVATGFVAAGIGLAILGLFVRRRSRRDIDEYDDEDDSGGRPYGGGSGTNTRI